MNTIKLFCFPYAGSSASFYASWRRLLSQGQGIEVIPVELPGRGMRFQEKLLDNIDDLIDYLFSKLITEFKDDTRYAFFGHSMGSILAYELYYKIASDQRPLPLHIFFSGKKPFEDTQAKFTHLLSEKEFKEELLRIGGTPQELVLNQELMEFYLPVLRTDFKIANTHRYNPDRQPLNCDITVLIGRDDNTLSFGDPDKWAKYTHKECTVRYFNGDHFFIHTNTALIVETIIETLSSYNLQMKDKRHNGSFTK